MKFLSVLSVALFSASVSAGFGFSTGSSMKQNTLDEVFKVPGDNPLTYCAKPEKDILEIEKVDLSPNPPKAYVEHAFFIRIPPLMSTCRGTTLTVTASGVFNEDVEEGAKVHLQVKYGLITIIRQTADLCDTVKNVDLECPLKKGKMTLQKDVELPKEIPPVRFRSRQCMSDCSLTSSCRESTLFSPTLSPRTRTRSPV